MSNWGGILAGALGGAADVAGKQAQRGMQEEAEMRASDRAIANSERLLASKQMMEQRADEYKQRQATMRAGEIDADAQGILTGQKVKGVQDMYGDPSLTKDDLLPEELAMIDTNEVDGARAQVTAADKRGYLTEAKDRRAVLDTERRFASDENRANEATRKNDLLEQDLKARGDRADSLAEKQLAAQASRDAAVAARESASSAREERAATSKAMDATVSLMRLKRDQLKETFDEPSKKALKDEISALDREAAGYRKALGSVGIEAPKGGGNTPAAADFVRRPTAPAAAPAAAAPSPQASTKAAPKAAGDDYLANATLKQLYDAVKGRDPVMARVAREELVKRRLLEDNTTTTGILGGAQPGPY